MYFEMVLISKALVSFTGLKHLAYLNALTTLVPDHNKFLFRVNDYRVNVPYCYLFKRVPILANFSEFGKIANNSIC